MARSMRISTRPNLDALIYQCAHMWAVFQPQSYEALNFFGLKAYMPARLHSDERTRPHAHEITCTRADLPACALAAGGQIRKRRPEFPG
jgi:hypothetical protein